MLHPFITAFAVSVCTRKALSTIVKRIQKSVGPCQAVIRPDTFFFMQYGIPQ